MNNTRAKHPDVYYGYIVTKPDEFYKIRFFKDANTEVPQRLSISFVSEEEAIYALHKYFGQER